MVKQGYEKWEFSLGRDALDTYLRFLVHRCLAYRPLYLSREPLYPVSDRARTAETSLLPRFMSVSKGFSKVSVAHGKSRDGCLYIFTPEGALVWTSSEIAECIQLQYSHSPENSHERQTDTDGKIVVTCPC